MNEFMKILLSLSVSGMLLLFFVLGLKPLYKNKFSKRWQYYIWIIVVLRFPLPFAPVNMSIGNLLEKLHTTIIEDEIFASPNISATVNADGSEAKQIPAKTQVKLYRNTMIASPMMIGFFHPSIILPVGELEDKVLSYIFVHELLHYKQRDMFYKWLIQIVICIHWFNPFVYLLEKEVNKACELSCDEAAICAFDNKARREYGDTLIYFLKANNLYKGSFTSVTLTEGAEQLMVVLIFMTYLQTIRIKPL